MYSKLINVLALAGVSFAHMAIISPCPRYSPNGVNCPALPSGQSLDYSMTSPLGENEPLCKHTVPFPTPCTTWTAGQQVSVQFAAGGAPHGGGHCQYSLSYDGGNTFVVVYEVLEHCFGADNNQRDFSFTLPSTLPSSDKVVFAWTWVNAIGNREFYMNCADVAIKGGSGTYTGKQMTIANHAGYPTIPEFSGNYATGLDLYQNAKNITVSGSGSTSGSSGSSSSSGSAGSSSSSASSDASSGNATSGASSSSGSGSGSSSYPASAAPEATPTATYTASISSNGSYTPVSSAYTTSIVPVSTAPALTTVSTYASSEPAPQGHNAADGSNGSSSSGGSCSNGAMQCSGSGYQVCIAGTWSQTYSCGPGTTCCGGGNSGVYCGWS